jgi:hypothetical protein
VRIAGTPHLCEDFRDGIPGKLSPAASVGAQLTADTANYESAPQSMLAMTPPVPVAGGESMAFGFYSAKARGASFGLQLDFQVGEDCFANGAYDNVTIAHVDYRTDLYGIASRGWRLGRIIFRGGVEVDRIVGLWKPGYLLSWLAGVQRGEADRVLAWFDQSASLLDDRPELDGTLRLGLVPR